MKNFLLVLQAIGAASAFAAAIFWFLSTRVRSPDTIRLFTVPPDEFLDAGFLGNPQGHVHSPDLNNLTNALKKQSSLNSWGAIFSAISATAQGIALAFPAPI
jgi:hypothetical protein